MKEGDDMHCIWKIIMASILALSTSISVAATPDPMFTQSRVSLYDSNSQQLPGEIAWFNSNIDHVDFQLIINASSYSILLAQGQEVPRSGYNNWPFSNTQESSPVEFHPVPEPASLLLIGLGMFVLALISCLQHYRNSCKILGKKHRQTVVSFMMHWFLDTKK
jgi:hypothetical protein